jgi:hypothetical protein
LQAVDMAYNNILNKEELVTKIEELLDESFDDLMAGSITTWDLANDIAIVVLK